LLSDAASFVMASLLHRLYIGSTRPPGLVWPCSAFTRCCSCVLVKRIRAVYILCPCAAACHKYNGNIYKFKIMLWKLTLLRYIEYIDPLMTKSRLLYLKNQSVPRCKHFSSRL